MYSARLPDESGGATAPLLRLRLRLRLLRLPWPRLVDVGGLKSTDALEPDVASAGGPCCDGLLGLALEDRRSR
jgi:hypothetical protein